MHVLYEFILYLSFTVNSSTLYIIHYTVHFIKVAKLNSGYSEELNFGHSDDHSAAHSAICDRSSSIRKIDIEIILKRQ